MKNGDISVKWYKSVVISSSDTIRATSNWYSQAVFDNISINMCNDEKENYKIYDGMKYSRPSIILWFYEKF